ncbi:MAG: carboxypeptidase-like regulatory domain-containing protein, partial [Bacteroidales bacterium]|nr:carboxypeptidase-like regulatory domain-containing protein [Bacteroidales bacterium]
MKKLLLTITLIFCGMMSFAQNDYYSVIKGNVSEKNVNITIINTSFGVSSDDKGDFIMMLPKMENKVGLLFSCIGYEDTLVSVIPNRDTININFKMKETSYMLDAVGVG